MSSFWKHLILDLYKNIDRLQRLSVQKKLCSASFSDLSVLIRFDTFSGRINLSLIQSAEWMKIKTYFENNFKNSLKINSIDLVSRKEFFVCQWKSCRQNVKSTIHCFECFSIFHSRTCTVSFKMLKLIIFFNTVVKCKNVISGDVYGNSTFPIILRDGSKLKSLVLNSDVAYLVQFFSFTCGLGLESLKLFSNIIDNNSFFFRKTLGRHCHEFAPIFSKFAESIDSWSTSLEVIAIECQGENHEFCHRGRD